MATSEKFFFTLYISLLNKRKMDNYIPHDKKAMWTIIKTQLLFPPQPCYFLSLSRGLTVSNQCQI